LGVSIDDFSTKYRWRRPHAQASSCESAASFLDWTVLGRVLADRPDAIVVAGGKLMDCQSPRTLDEMNRYLASGIGLCVRHAEKHDDGLAEVADAFSVFGRPQVQLFVTAPRTHGFGWHYDDEEVFIAQTTGHKRYFFRANTVTANEAAHGSMFSRFAQERSPMCMTTLISGDFLYLPARWWHVAICEETALSISVGVSQTGASIA
jgi:hypothetical protein